MTDMMGLNICVSCAPLPKERRRSTDVFSDEFLLHNDLNRTVIVQDVVPSSAWYN